MSPEAAPARATAVGVRFVDFQWETRRRYAVVDSAIGPLLLVGDGRALLGVEFDLGEGHTARIRPDWVADPAPLAEAAEQLQDYLAGERTVFDLPVAVGGSDFQRRVWKVLAEIPYGHTTSYGRIAARLGRPSASRAVGLANGRNPLPIVLPCHRVVGASGALTGYGGGLDRKRWLLDLERRHARN
ncbi:MAG TPA: methylated-DNA--[protein]-cysteine S-methyltransferase [Actinomycetes bacterium]